jgi:hypothetical protein
LFADIASAVFPRNAILHLAGPVNKVVLVIAFLAFEAIDVEASLQFANTALEFEIGKAISALSPLIPDASLLHGLADAFEVEVVSAVAGDTAILVVGLAVGNFAVSIGQLERLVALLADVGNFVPASKH